VNDLVCLYNSAMKSGVTRKFHRPWTGPYKIKKRISELNYKITSQSDKKQVVHKPPKEILQSKSLET